jgi:hypothetical protein
VVGRLFEDHDRFGTDTIELHRVGAGLGLEALLEGFHVGYFSISATRLDFAVSVKSWPVMPIGPMISCRLGE